MINEALYAVEVTPGKPKAGQTTITVDNGPQIIVNNGQTVVINES